MRPRAEGLKYFPHDVDASSDEKIEILRSLYGNDGYTFYFILLERIYRSNDCEIDISDIETRRILAKKIDVSMEKFDSMLDTALKNNCFDIEVYNSRGVLTSNGIKKRAEMIINKRLKMRERYRNRISSLNPTSETSVSSLVSEAETGEENIIDSELESTIKDISNLFISSVKKIKKDVIVDIDECESTISDMIIIDKRNPSTIRKVIEHTRKDKFWKKVVLSPSILRKNFDKIEASMTSDVSNWIEEG